MDDNWEPGTPKYIWVQHFVEYGNFFEYKKFLIQKMSWSKNVGPSIFLGHGHKEGIYLEADYGILAPIVRVFSKWPEKFGLDASLGCQSFKT